MKRKWISLFTAAVLLFGLAACNDGSSIGAADAGSPAETSPAGEAAPGGDTSAEPAATGQSFRIGIFVKDTVNPFWRYVVDGAMREGEKYDDTTVVEYSPVETQNVEEQIRQIEDAIESKINAICIVALDAAAVKPALQQAVDAGITVITFNSRVEIDAIPTFIGVENYEGQYKVAEKVFEDLGHEGKIVILQGLVAGYANKERTRAIEECAAKYPGIEIIASQSVNARRDEAMSTMENLLQTHSQIDAVFGHNDSVAMGAIQAIQDAGREGEIIVSGFDGTVEGMEAVRDGLLKYTIDQSPYQQGAYSVRTARQVLLGETVEAEISTGGNLIEQSNAQQAIDNFENID